VRFPLERAVKKSRLAHPRAKSKTYRQTSRLVRQDFRLVAISGSVLAVPFYVLSPVKLAIIGEFDRLTAERSRRPNCAVAL